jgi:hypothetical protein
MKKLSVLLVAGLLVLALTMPAAAFENEFGGYWRTRFITDIDFAGTTGGKSDSQSVNITDTRTRIYYTAKFSENLKFVNKFEVNAAWGQNGGYGQMGADNSGADTFRVKNSYVDFKLAEQRFTVGVQDFLLARGYIYNDDASGAKLIFKVNDAIYIPFIYMKNYEGGYGYIQQKNGSYEQASTYDMSTWVLYPTIFLNKDNTLKPHVAYLYSENAALATAKNVNMFNSPKSSTFLPGATKVDLWTAGLEYDGKIDIFELGATGIMQFGSIDVPQAVYGTDSLDLKGYLFDVFGGVNLGPANIHGKFIYASGNDHNDVNSSNIDAFVTPGQKDNWGASYYWAEIMGDGVIDNQTPLGAPGDKISNVYIANLGASYKLLPQLKFAADLWWAQHAEDVPIATSYGPQQYSKDLGTEIDLVATYTIVDNLKVDLVGAYLWAGDCITRAVDPTGDSNPIELAAMLSLAF